MKVRKKPVVVDAYKMENEFFQLDAPAWVKEACNKDLIFGYARVETLEGEMFCPFGHYLIRGVEGEIYACDPNIFHKTYDIVEEEN